MISADEVRRAFSYDEETGVLSWVNPHPDSRGMVGRAVTARSNSGYIVVTINKVKYQAHRIIWLYVTGFMPREFIDHINGNKDDNRFCNLREASRGQNGMNRPANLSNLSGHKNVYPNKGGFLVRVTACGKSHQKWFKRLDDAVECAASMRASLHMQFANHEQAKKDN